MLPDATRLSPEFFGSKGSSRRIVTHFSRYIYIHGTPEERNIGVASSYGCIRMRSADVISLYDTVGVGARVVITPMPFKRDGPM